jgi:hypothetical protein
VLFLYPLLYIFKFKKKGALLIAINYNNPTVMKLFIKHCLSRHNLAGSVKVAVIVGIILGAINHFDMFLYWKIEKVRIIKIIITYFVPFFVSLYGGVMYGRHCDLERKNKEQVD